MDYASISTVIFDLGGVLIDWNPRYLYQKIFKTEESISYFLEEVCPYHWNEEQDAGRAWKDGIEERVRLFPQYRYEIEAYYSRWPEMLGGEITENVVLLQRVAANPNLQTLALTNWSAETFPIAQEQFSFLSLFDGIVVSGIEKVKKPDPLIFEILIERFLLNPKECLFIDDSLRNIEAAGKLQFQTFHYHENQRLAPILEPILSKE